MWTGLIMTRYDFLEANNIWTDEIGVPISMSMGANGKLKWLQGVQTEMLLRGANWNASKGCKLKCPQGCKLKCLQGVHLNVLHLVLCVYSSMLVICSRYFVTIINIKTHCFHFLMLCIHSAFVQLHVRGQSRFAGSTYSQCIDSQSWSDTKIYSALIELAKCLN